MRLLPEQKSRIERAAHIKGMSVSEFTAWSSDEAAKRTIGEETIWALGDQDRDAFVHAVLNPHEPNDAIRAAAARYKQWTAGR